MTLPAGAATCAAVIIAAMVSAAGGCGFHLRGYTFVGHVDSYYVESDTGARMRDPLERSLKLAGATAAPGPGGADVVIRMIDGRRERRSVSVAGDVGVAEYELSIELNYAIVGRDGQTLREPGWVRVQRVYRLDRGNVMGSSEERELIERELENDLAQQIVRTLNVVTRPPDGAA